MMTKDEAKRLINDLRGRFSAPYNQSDKETIVELYFAVCGKVFRPTSCQNCYHDAVIEIYNHLKRYNTMAAERHYLLKAGAIINSPVFDKGKIYTNENLTDDVAERYLDMFPSAANLFQRLPEKTAKTDVESKKAAKVGELPTETRKTAQKGRKTAKRK